MTTLLLALAFCAGDTTVNPIHQFRDTVPAITVTFDTASTKTLMGQRKWSALMELVRKTDSIKAADSARLRNRKSRKS